MRATAFVLVMGYALANGPSPMAAFSILDASDEFRLGLAPRVGRATKHPLNPLWGQDQPWELRIDNGYADVFYNASDPLGAYRMWYTSFTECPDNVTDDKGRYVNCGGGGRWFLGLYANSTDGISWEKPALDNTCYAPGQHDHGTSCDRPGALRGGPNRGPVSWPRFVVASGICFSLRTRA